MLIEKLKLRVDFSGLLTVKLIPAVVCWTLPKIITLCRFNALLANYYLIPYQRLMVLLGYMHFPFRSLLKS